MAVVLEKPGGVPCHASDYVGKGSDLPVPLLQRGRVAVGQPINLVHRLDCGASGCVLCTFSDKEEETGATAALQEALREAKKTYVALVRGSGVLYGEDLSSRGWFSIDRPIKDYKGRTRDATTQFRFVAGTTTDADAPEALVPEGAATPVRSSIVLARPQSGRWHQIRRHLNGLSHPILGDSSHGNSRTNREWREKRGLPYARMCLHLARIEVPATSVTPALDVTCPLPRDMQDILTLHMPDVLERGRGALSSEAGIDSCESSIRPDTQISDSLNSSD